MVKESPSSVVGMRSKLVHFPGMFAVGKGKYGEKCDFRILFAPKTEINHKKIDCCQKLPWKWQTIIGQYKKKKIDPFFRCFGCHEEQIWSDMDALGWLVPQIMKLPINALQIKQNTQKYQATQSAVASASKLICFPDDVVSWKGRYSQICLFWGSFSNKTESAH